MIAVTPMRILSETENTRIEERQLALNEGLSVGKLDLSSRRILSFSIFSDGYLGVGEAAPLPGYSSETYEECLQTLQKAAHELQLRLCESIDAPARILDGITCPSARFAVEQALVALRSQRSGWTLRETWANYLQTPLLMDSSIDVSGLVIDFSGEEARSLCDRGFTTLKLKVGPGDLSKLERFLEDFPDVDVRLDANQRLSVKEARAYAGLPISVFEEPVPSALLPELAEDGLSISLDESLREPNMESLLDLPCVRGLVLKPMTLGGGARCFDWVKRAQTRQQTVTFTHCFDGFLSYRATCQLASLVDGGVHGLASHRCLDAWLLANKSSMSIGARLAMSELEAVGA